MSTIDRMRIAAVKVVEALGYTFEGVEWKAPAVSPTSSVAEADAMHGLLLERADRLAGCVEDSEEEKERAAIAVVVAGYEASRWPDGRTQEGKG